MFPEVSKQIFQEAELIQVTAWLEILRGTCLGNGMGDLICCMLPIEQTKWAVWFEDYSGKCCSEEGTHYILDKVTRTAPGHQRAQSAFVVSTPMLRPRAPHVITFHLPKSPGCFRGI